MRFSFLAIFLTLSLLTGEGQAAEPLEITADTTLDPQTTYGPLVIKASHVTIDGRGAWIVGTTTGNPKNYLGVGVLGEGVSHVTLKNVNVKGWETGLKVSEGSNWLIENCNLSDNFHDPSFGWGENGRRGGIVLERVQKSRLVKNKANRVWDACVLVDSNQNVLEENDFSRTSNTCLKLWHACDNLVRKNNLSYGLRKDPGEVHARDSTSVLIESGSNDNRLIENDCTHGGDGIFIRVLNQWVSTGNLCEGNDCSYANNNAVEAWSPRNTYIRNKANHSSYGFWLGASDQTVLIDNEASFNGLLEGFHNSPHLPDRGHAGIVFMFGPSSHTIVRGNTCVGNNGAGVALIGDLDSKGQKFKAYHWIIEQNTFRDNRWGIYAQHADWIDVASNVFENNSVAEFWNAGNVSRLTQRPGLALKEQPPRAQLTGPTTAKIHESLAFDASSSRDPSGRALTYLWDFGDGTTANSAKPAPHVYDKPGFYRVGLTVTNGVLSDLAWRDLYVVGQSVEIGTEGQASDWEWVDPQSRVKFSNDERVKIAGKSSLYAHVSPYGGFRLNLAYPAAKQARWSLAGKSRVVFWFKGINENLPAWQDANPIVTLHESAERFVKLTPQGDFLSSPPFNEAREGWYYFEVPLAGSAKWKREGADLETVNWLTIGFDSWGAPPLQIWLDGLALE
ncbi:MAG: right-handed parallel beta-helix repeat-containing protein [Planctomycetes bacterium]|nr:right-handed parallel beta-helix repeat-containing protein [Planctomycetota bacterium]